MMTTHYLIDYESIQPRQLEDGIDSDTTITLFIGPHQHRLPIELVMRMQALGERGRYVKIERAGKNALDFHLAFYLGELASRDPQACYRILSKDSGFDSLIEHLQARGLDSARLECEDSARTPLDAESIGTRPPVGS
ncbi:MAG: PIN domain-containing protein [Lamprobacter sp.]|uniref:PIN domain-containing protein n=1 Tax=Lamprobacter sp. TaxID=3100796 RepID=UPI002B25A0BE|nr:PIN domain-containing protein [Lamprobacter sp.]MEA3643993.1 PIN domain-containing protein [Lamprobacter sp.]